MGLDISLINIVRKPTDELCWLNSDESPELLSSYKDFFSERTHEDGTKEQGYWYEELAYQRKGVLKSFYDKYDADEFIFTEPELLTLNQYIHPDNKLTFHVDFLDKFNEGSNFVMMGY
ncbi:hypothetical protein [uncultured Roseivirga sp.]|uniref:hypothetical protein n=1 Tax=uncultured Roseivirga sp. TaxID=543088 RepID=UPI000D7A2ECA|nr:hypothetical protein [uncultured Roseivirga sp.]PWL29118.1 MAG: hypothetical protein DCO95_11805 [Roseivirga sp. XM-24bin3]